MLSKEKEEEIKKQLINQINSTFPEDKKSFAINQIQGMSSEQLIEFLKQNKLISTEPAEVIKAKQNQKEPLPSLPEDQASQMSQASTAPVPSKCIFCSIINKHLPSYRIDYNKSAIAILEINPISKGHVLILPREHISSKDRLPQQVFSLAKKISKKLKSKLKPKPQDVEIAFSNLFGHEVVNVFPLYNNENINSERHHETEENLKKLQKKLERKVRKRKTSSKTKSESKKKSNSKKEKSHSKHKEKPKLWLPRRIP